MTLALWFGIPYTDGAKRPAFYLPGASILGHSCSNRYLNRAKQPPRKAFTNNGWKPSCADLNNAMAQYARSSGISRDDAQREYVISSNSICLHSLTASSHRFYWFLSCFFFSCFLFP